MIRTWEKNSKIRRHNYQSSSDDFEEEASNNGANKLGNPVEDAGEDGDLATQSQSESDRRIDMATRDICTHCHRNKECKPMANCYRH